MGDKMGKTLLLRSSLFDYNEMALQTHKIKQIERQTESKCSLLHQYTSYSLLLSQCILRLVYSRSVRCAANIFIYFSPRKSNATHTPTDKD